MVYDSTKKTGNRFLQYIAHTGKIDEDCDFEEYLILVFLTQ